MTVGIRARLAITLVALVAVTVAAIGVGVYAFVDASLRARLIADARQQVDYNLSVLLPGADPRPTDERAFKASGLPTAFALRGSGSWRTSATGCRTSPPTFRAPSPRSRRSCAAS
jgi:hypothetical protein